jgi:hypothetical protein
MYAAGNVPRGVLFSRSIYIAAASAPGYTCAMGDGIAASGNELKQRIRTLVSESERLFLKFADTFPVFVAEMNRSLE